MSETVAILGASPNPERYAHKALVRLQSAGHKVVLVNPAHDMIDGLPVVKSLEEISEPVDTVTIYVGADKISAFAQSILHLRPRRVIFNPGTENREVMEMLEKNGINVVQACTLVLLATKQF